LELQNEMAVLIIIIHSPHDVWILHKPNGSIWKNEYSSPLWPFILWSVVVVGHLPIGKHYEIKYKELFFFCLLLFLKPVVAASFKLLLVVVGCWLFLLLPW
jgi:hypothetical protein